MGNLILEKTKIKSNTMVKLTLGVLHSFWQSQTRQICTFSHFKTLYEFLLLYFLFLDIDLTSLEEHKMQHVCVWS